MQLSTAPAGATAAELDDLRALMEEPVGGANFGRQRKTVAEPQGSQHFELGVQEAQVIDLFMDGGWTMVHAKHGRDAGMVAHRGTLHPEDHVDADALRAAIIARLGFTYDEVHSVYRQGRLSIAQGELRARIDARLLALSRAGGEVHKLGGLLGFPMRPSRDGGDRCEVVSNALARARAAEEMAA